MNGPLVHLKAVGEDFSVAPDSTLERLAQLSVSGVEPFIPARATRLRRRLDAVGLSAPIVQGNLLSDTVTVRGRSMAAAPLEHVFDRAADLGATTVIDPIVQPQQWRTRDKVDRTADRLNKAAATAATFGLRVGYHNHSFEFRHMIDGRSAYEVFAARLAPEVVLELDVYWAATGGCNVVELTRSLGARVTALHLTDGPIGADPFFAGAGVCTPSMRQTPLGEGAIPIPAVLAAAEFVEHPIIDFDDVGGDVYAAIADSAAFIRARVEEKTDDLLAV